MLGSQSQPAKRKLITISIPVFNEEGNIPALLARLRAVAEQANKYDFEFLFTDNDSQDRTVALLEEEVARDARVRVLKFSRNFGFQRSILTNLLEARGDAAIQIDADMQDPPEMILKYLEHWEKGYKVVYGVRRHRTESFLLLAARKAFYRFVDRITEFPVPVDAALHAQYDGRPVWHHRRVSRPDFRQRAGAPYEHHRTDNRTTDGAMAETSPQQRSSSSNNLAGSGKTI